MNPQAFIASEFPSLGALLVGALGIGIGVARWRRHPRVSLIAVSAFSIHLVAMLLNSIWRQWAFSAKERGIPTEEIIAVSAVAGPLLVLLQLIFLILVVIAVFSGRVQQPFEEVEPHSRHAA